jgi:hypothetical protein
MPRFFERQGLRAFVVNFTAKVAVNADLDALAQYKSLVDNDDGSGAEAGFSVVEGLILGPRNPGASAHRIAPGPGASDGSTPCERGPVQAKEGFASKTEPAPRYKGGGEADLERRVSKLRRSALVDYRGGEIEACGSPDAPLIKLHEALLPIAGVAVLETKTTIAGRYSSGVAWCEGDSPTPSDERAASSSEMERD